MTTMTKDAQVSRVYKSEELFGRLLDNALEFPFVQIWGSQIPVPSHEKKFGDLDGVRRYVLWLFSTPWMSENYPDAKAPGVMLRRGDKMAHYQWGTIYVPAVQRGGRWAMREIVVLHEVAHHLTRGVDQSHGTEFTQAFLALVTEYLGEEAGFILKHFYISNEVK